MRQPSTEWLMQPERSGRVSRRKTPGWPLNTRGHKCDQCRKELPACTCEKRKP